jgi:hypothetical protein
MPILAGWRSITRRARGVPSLAGIVLSTALTLACGGDRSPLTRDEAGGATPPTVTSLSWRNRQVGLGSDRARSFCCLDPIGFTCVVEAPDTPSVTVYLSFQDQQGTCRTRQNCWTESQVLSTSSGPSVVLAVVKEAPANFTPSLLTCWAANSRGYASRPLSVSLDVPRGDGP